MDGGWMVEADGTLHYYLSLRLAGWLAPSLARRIRVALPYLTYHTYLELADLEMQAAAEEGATAQVVPLTCNPRQLSSGTAQHLPRTCLVCSVRTPPSRRYISSHT